VFCVKGKRGVILLGYFSWQKTNPNGKEDTPHVRIFVEGNCKECKSGTEGSQCI
jgi:hypothetical protein